MVDRQTNIRSNTNCIAIESKSNLSDNNILIFHQSCLGLIRLAHRRKCKQISRLKGFLLERSARRKDTSRGRRRQLEWNLDLQIMRTLRASHQNLFCNRGVITFLLQVHPSSCCSLDWAPLVLFHPPWDVAFSPLLRRHSRGWLVETLSRLMSSGASECSVKSDPPSDAPSGLWRRKVVWFRCLSDTSF